MEEHIIGNLDFPHNGVELSGYSIMVQGWAMSTQGKEIDILIFVDDKPTFEGKTGANRPDVAKDYPTLLNADRAGFLHKVNLQDFEDGNHKVSVIAKSKSMEKSLGSASFVLFKNMFKRKQEKIIKLLVCPVDKKELEHRENSLFCKSCQREFPIRNDIPILLPDGKPGLQYVSSNHFPPSVIEVLKKNPNGLVLNDGSGYPHQQFENMIFLETSELPSTNVVGYGEFLPFPDESIDAVISLSVIEHVEDPFSYAKEISRVCKKGGEIVIDSGFMVPIHNYPQHYFNTTLEGLKLLFKDFKVITASIEDYQKPWISLQWILKSYLGGLEPKDREKFLNKKIADLIQDSSKGGFKDVTKLSKYATEELAAGVHIHAIKE